MLWRPAMFGTNLLHQLIAPGKLDAEALIRRTPMKRLAEAEEVAELYRDRDAQFSLYDRADRWAGRRVDGLWLYLKTHLRGSPEDGSRYLGGVT